jgi:anthranilate synthase/aminodeoxychorismate synthase-like glutamine amidotransferase
MPPHVLVIDNYDSFTFNLVQYLGELGARVEVFKNDAIDVAGIRARAPDGVLISPGPCTPNEAGVSLDLIGALGGQVPILGVCLGHQAIGQAYGGRVVRAGRLMHGKTSPILHDGRGVFEGLPSPFDATRYHSLLVDRATLPDCLEVSAWTAEGEIMGLRHRVHDVEGVQFHPESVLTVEGKRLVGNWLARVAPRQRKAS